MISFSKNFQTSVNIAYDFENAEKIKDFIPTSEGIKFINETILSATNKSSSFKNANRARILIGAYGKGKSYIVLEALSFLHNNPQLHSTLENVAEKIAQTNPIAAENILQYIKSGKRLLPIIINGNSESLSKSFLYELNLTLKKNEFKDLMPETHFEAAAKMIEKWESDFPETFKKFNELASTRANTFKEKLRNFDSDAFDEFENLYPVLTSGSEFNPFAGFDVVDIFEKVNEKLCATGKYDGIFVVYDEFGKYLESSISTATIKDVKLLQDFAERAERSKENPSGKNQLHLLLICHKEIENYIDVLPKQKIDGWKGVSERFLHVRLFNTYSESYSLISATILKDKTLWNKFYENHKIYFENLAKEWFGNAFRLFSEESNDKIICTIIQGCFPIHPVTSYILPRLSEKVAQNERTLFTFLSGTEKTSLPSLVQKTENVVSTSTTNTDFNIFTPDVLFDYFEKQMQNESYATEIKKNYLVAKSALNIIEAKSSENNTKFLELKIIKTISLVYCLNQFERLSPDLNFIFAIYADAGYSKEEILEAIKNLTENLGVLYLNVHNNYFQIKENSGADIPKLIFDEIEKRKSKVCAVDILNEFNTEKYLYPTKYNVTNKITRYFKFLFVDDFDDKQVTSKNFADGKILALFSNENDFNFDFDAENENAKKLSLKNEDIVFILPNKNFHQKNLIENLQKFDAVVSLKKLFTEDFVVSSELEIIYLDLLEVVKKTVCSYIQPEENSVIYIADGKVKKLYRKTDLSNLLSEKCKKNFSKTPIINNEMLNKNRLTGAAQKSRAKLIDAILTSKEKNLGLSGNGQDVSFMRTALVVPGILNNENIFNFSPKTSNSKNDENFSNLFSVINDFLKKSEEKEISFTELVEHLVKPKYQIGLRLGVIPIYIAVALRSKTKTCVIKKDGIEIQLCSRSLSELSENPERFTLKIEKWSDNKSFYIQNLEKLFADFLIEDEKSTYQGYSYLLNAINRWQRSLSKYAKNVKQKPYSFFIEILKQENSCVQEILFEKIPKVFDEKEANETVFEKVKKSKLFFDNALSNLEETVGQKTVKKIVGKDSQKSLKNVIADFVTKIPPKVENFVFENNAHSLLKVYKSVVQKDENDEQKIVEEISKVLTGISCDDWGTETEEIYFSRLEELNNTLINYTENNQLSKKEKFQNTTSDENYIVHFANEETQKSFSKVECSQRAKILEKEISRTLDEVGQSVTQSEKRQVLVNLLEELCK